MIRLFLPLVILALCPLPAGADPAPEPKGGEAAVKCTIRSILGAQAPGGIAKELDFLRQQLSRPPFSAYKSLRLLEAKHLEVALGAHRELSLPNGKVLRLAFQERLLGRKDRLRLRLHLAITPPKQKRFLPGTLFTIRDRGTLLVAGDRHQGGTLVVGITCAVK